MHSVFYKSSLRPTEQSELRRTTLSVKVSVTECNHTADPAPGPAGQFPRPSTITFAQYVQDRFLPGHVAHKTRAGRIHYEAMLKHVLRPESVNRIFGNAPQTSKFLKAVPGWPYLDEVLLSDLTPDHVREILSSAMAGGYSAQTVKHIKNVIGAVISHARNEGCFSGPNPAEQVKLPPVVHTPRLSVSARHVFRVLEKMQYPEREIALLTMFTTLGLTAACRLQWKHLNLTLSFNTVDGDPLPPVSIRVPTSEKATSTGLDSNSSAHIAIPTTVLPALLDLKWRRSDTNPENFVFASRKGTRISPAKARSALRKIGAAEGVPSIAWQDFRNVYKKFAREFLHKPYSTWAADELLPSKKLSARHNPSPVFIQPIRRPYTSRRP